MEISTQIQLQKSLATHWNSNSKHYARALGPLALYNANTLWFPCRILWVVFKRHRKVLFSFLYFLYFFSHLYWNSHAQGEGDVDKHQLSRLHMILKPFMLRRVKKDVELELGDKVFFFFFFFFSSSFFFLPFFLLLPSSSFFFLLLPSSFFFLSFFLFFFFLNFFSFFRFFFRLKLTFLVNLLQDKKECTKKLRERFP